MLTPPSGWPRQTPSASSTRLPSDPRLTVRARPTRSPERLLPTVDIALAGSHVQHVAARLTDQPAAVGARLGQPLAQARDMHLQARRAHAREAPRPTAHRSAGRWSRRDRPSAPGPRTAPAAADPPAPPPGHPPAPRPDRATRSATHRSCRPSRTPPRVLRHVCADSTPRRWRPVGAPLAAGWRPPRRCSPCTTTPSLRLSPKRASPTCRGPPPTAAATVPPRRHRRHLRALAVLGLAAPPPSRRPARSPSPRTTPPPRRSTRSPSRASRRPPAPSTSKPTGPPAYARPEPPPRRSRPVAWCRSRSDGT